MHVLAESGALQKSILTEGLPHDAQLARMHEQDNFLAAD